MQYSDNHLLSPQKLSFIKISPQKNRPQNDLAEFRGIPGATQHRPLLQLDNASGSGNLKADSPEKARRPGGWCADVSHPQWDPEWVRLITMPGYKDEEALNTIHPVTPVQR